MLAGLVRRRAPDNRVVYPAYGAYAEYLDIVNRRYIVYHRGVTKSQERPYPVKKLVGLTAELAAQIADYRYGHRIPSENEAIRRLIELGLKAATRAAGPRQR